jgi:hypothetical protein
MSHKRTLSSGEVPAAKKMSAQDSPPVDTQNVDIPIAASNTTPDPRWIYVATRQVQDPYDPTTHEVLEAYATVRDANWGIKHLQRDDDLSSAEWDEDYDINGCLYLSTLGEDGAQIELKVVRVPMMVAGTVEPPEDISESEEEDGEREDGGNDDDEAPSSAEEEEEEPENGFDEYAEIREAQQKGGPKEDCHGSGCGAPLCSSCWPQTEEEWEALS